MKDWKLFIDDERDPVGDDWLTVRNSDGAILAVMAFGMPNEIAFDHDLGGDDTSIKFIHWLMNQVMDGVYDFPDGFTYSVHSQNPVGARNIKNKMDDLLMYHRGLYNGCR